MLLLSCSCSCCTAVYNVQVDRGCCCCCSCCTVVYNIHVTVAAGRGGLRVGVNLCCQTLHKRLPLWRLCTHKSVDTPEQTITPTHCEHVCKNPGLCAERVKTRVPGSYLKSVRTKGSFAGRPLNTFKSRPTTRCRHADEGIKKPNSPFE